MRSLTPCFLAAALTLVGLAPLSAQVPPLRTDIRPERPKVQILYRQMSGFSADFSGTYGSIPFRRAIPPFDNTIVNRTYDDGAVFSPGGDIANPTTTQNFRFDNQSQVAGDFIAMNLFGSQGSQSIDFAGETGSETGFEMVFTRNFRRIGSPTLRVGALVGFGLTGIDIEASSQFSADMDVLTDLYDLLGQIPPQAPYNSAFFLPEDRISIALFPANRERVLLEGEAEIDLTTGIKGSAYSVRVGPTVELRLGRKWTLFLSGGLNTFYVSANFEIDQTFTDLNGNASRSTERFRNNETIFGPYGDLQVIYHLGERASFSLGAQYIKGGSVDFEAGDRRARLDMDSITAAVLGLHIRF
jgi:hypothetical protein